jgi:hypothetical protein
MASLLTLARVRLGRDRRVRRPAPQHSCRAQEDIAADLPDEDVGEELTDALDLYVMGSKPRCEEAEYLDLIQSAIERHAHGS